MLYAKSNNMATITTDPAIQKMARVINQLYSLVEQQAEELKQIKQAINADMHLVDSRISVTEAAKILGVSIATVNRLIDDGKLNVVGCTVGGGKRYLSKKQVESLKYLPQ